MITSTNNEFSLVWVNNFYDKPLGGLCKVNGKLRRFTSEYEEEGYTTYPLTFIEKVKWLARKRLFEICVGKHFTYKNNQRMCHFYWRKPVWLHHLLFNWYFKNVS